MRQAHRPSRLREAIDLVAFLVCAFIIILLLSIDGIH